MRLPRPARGAWAAALFLVTLTALLLSVSWRRWCDPLGDFGHDLYVAWRISEGEVLHRDLAHFNGPFSPYFNGAALWLFGPHVLSLNLVNAALALGVLGLLYDLVRRLADRFAATLGGAAFLVMFAFAHLLPTGDFNFVAPYSHEATHGMLFSLLALWLLVRARESGSRCLALLAGVSLGIVLLTKAEIALAAVVAVATFAWASAHPAAALHSRYRELLALLSGLLLCLAGAFAYLAMRDAPREALLAMLGSFRHVARPEVLSLPNFASAMGLAGVRDALATAGFWTVLWAVVIVPLLAASLRTPRDPTLRRAVLVACFLFPLALIGAGVTAVPWLGAFRPLPVVLAGVLLWQHHRRRCGAGGEESSPLALAFVVFSLVLLARMAAHVTVCHYGFVLALPGTLVLLTALVSWLPQALSAAGNHGAAFRAGAIGLAVGIIAIHFVISLRWYGPKTAPLGTGADSILVGDKGPVLAVTLAEIERRVPPGGTVLALPGGALLNVMAHRPSPTPFVSFFPPEFAIFGEEAMLQALRRRPPELAVLFTRSTMEYGFPRFGVGYGERVMAWMAPRYSPVLRIGGDPREGRAFGALILAPFSATAALDPAARR